jgi:hypothetical protein
VEFVIQGTHKASRICVAPVMPVLAHLSDKYTWPPTGDLFKMPHCLLYLAHLNVTI